MQVSPESRQANDLKKLVDDKIIKEGLIGLGVVGGVLGGVLGITAVIVGGLLAGRR